MRTQIKTEIIKGVEEEEIEEVVEDKGDKIEDKGDKIEDREINIEEKEEPKLIKVTQEIVF